MEEVITYKILTYGRLGREFSQYVNTLPGFDCVFLENDQLADNIKNFDIIAGLALPVEVDISHLKWVHAFSAGVDAWVNRKDLSNQLVLTKTGGRMGLKMGEYCLTYILNFLKKTDLAKKHQENHTWSPEPQENLFDQNVLVLSTGSVGKGIANVLTPLVNEIIGVNSTGGKAEYFNDTIAFNRLPDDLSKYSVVINSLPLTSGTREVINEFFFNKLKNCLYMNVGRGETTNHKDLLEALKAGRVKRAVLDVFPTEPLSRDSELWDHPAITITPHQSAITDIEDVKRSFIQAFEAFKNNVENEYVVNLRRGY